MMTTRIPVTELKFGADNGGSVQYDWSEGFDEKWQSWEAALCRTCGTLSTGECENEECEAYGTEVKTFEGPMMNYYYPFDPLSAFDPNEAAKALANLPLCVVQVDETWGLALTGGGMDMSWEIVEAFTRIGLLPPAWIRLAAMADKYRDERTQYIIAALRRSLTAARDRIDYDLRDLAHVEESLRARNEA